MTRRLRDELKQAIDQARRAQLARHGGYDQVERTRVCAWCRNDYHAKPRNHPGKYGLYFCPKPATCRQNFHHEQARIRDRRTLERAFGAAA